MAGSILESLRRGYAEAAKKTDKPDTVVVDSIRSAVAQIENEVNLISHFLQKDRKLAALTQVYTGDPHAKTEILVGPDTSPTYTIVTKPSARGSGLEFTLGNQTFFSVGAVTTTLAENCGKWLDRQHAATAGGPRP
jgi:hypothetical protein